MKVKPRHEKAARKLYLYLCVLPEKEAKKAIAKALRDSEQVGRDRERA